MAPVTPLRFRFRSSQRLSGQKAFRRVFDEGRRTGGGPLTLWAAPNGLPHSRLGLSIGRRNGHAVRRNQLKRKLREAFRLLQHELPIGHDFVISSRRHDDLPLAEYQRLFQKMAARTMGG